MYHKQANKTAIQSQHMIADALFSLMKRKPFQQITVTAICEEAAVGRKTFYRNFELKEDVLDFKMDELYERYVEEIEPIPLEERLTAHFAFLRKHMDYMKILYQSGQLDILTNKFSALTPKMMPLWSDDPVEQQYISAYVVAGTNAIVQVWVERDFEEDSEAITAIAQRAHLRQFRIK